MANCSVSDCQRTFYASGFCRFHYDRTRRRGTTEPPAPRVQPLCKEDGCGKPVHSRELCQMHYRRLMKKGTTEASTPLPEMTVELFYGLTERHENGCLLWKGSTDRDGYGRFYRVSDRKIVTAHRWIYEQEVGPIPDKKELDHLCHDPAVCHPERSADCLHRGCVDVRHLAPATPRENIMRSGGLAPANAAKTHCPQGHPYDAANTYLTTTGKRRCRQCGNTHQQEYLARLRETKAALDQENRKSEQPQGEQPMLIKTDVPCPGCGENLCNLCGFNGMCQDCQTCPRAHGPLSSPTSTSTGVQADSQAAF